MKTPSKVLATTLTVAGMLILGNPGHAQYKPTGDDGIAASPKFRQFLNEFKRSRSPAPPLAKVGKMACAKCIDKVSTRVDHTARGADKPTIRVVTHQCEGCGTEWNRVGHGRAKEIVASHKCTACGSASDVCCATSKAGTGPTKGMEKNSDATPGKH